MWTGLQRLFLWHIYIILYLNDSDVPHGRHILLTSAVRRKLLPFTFFTDCTPSFLTYLIAFFYLNWTSFSCSHSYLVAYSFIYSFILSLTLTHIYFNFCLTFFSQMNWALHLMANFTILLPLSRSLSRGTQWQLHMGICTCTLKYLLTSTTRVHTDWRNTINLYDFSELQLEFNFKEKKGENEEIESCLILIPPGHRCFYLRM